MLVQDFADLAKLLQQTIEEDFGLKTKVQVNDYFCPKEYKPMGERLGVGIFGEALVLQSPTGKPVGHFFIKWCFQANTGESDEEGETLWKNWFPAPKSWMNYSEHTPPLTAESKVRSLCLDVGYSWKWSEIDLTDLRCLIRQKLKGAFPEVTIRLTD